jgi:hypothetical protein
MRYPGIANLIPEGLPRAIQEPVTNKDEGKEGLYAQQQGT